MFIVAWIHPEINGNYRIIGVTSGTREAEEPSPYANYKSLVTSDIMSLSNFTDISSFNDWEALVSVYSPANGPGFEVEASSLYGSYVGPVYNSNGDLVTDQVGGLFGPLDFNNPISYNLDGTAGPTRVWTGSGASGDGAGALNGSMFGFAD